MKKLNIDREKVKIDIRLQDFESNLGICICIFPFHILKRVEILTMTEQKKINVESFNLDTIVRAPFVCLAGVKKGVNGDVIHKYDIRFCQPKKEHMEILQWTKRGSKL